MTLTTANIEFRNTTSSVLSRISRAFQAHMAGRRAARRAMDELAYLSARDLADLGISRYDFASIADHARKAAVAKSLAG